MESSATKGQEQNANVLQVMTLLDRPAHGSKKTKTNICKCQQRAMSYCLSETGKNEFRALVPWLVDRLVHRLVHRLVD